MQRTETGAFLPSAEVVNYLAAFQWDPKLAAHKIAPKLRDSWFGEALLPRLTASGQGMDEKAAVGILGETASASREYEERASDDS